MTKNDNQPTQQQPTQQQPTQQQQVRQARLAAELRANLKKRKTLAREKTTAPDDDKVK